MSRSRPSNLFWMLLLAAASGCGGESEPAEPSIDHSALESAHARIDSLRARGSHAAALAIADSLVAAPPIDSPTYLQRHSELTQLSLRHIASLEPAARAAVVEVDAAFPRARDLLQEAAYARVDSMCDAQLSALVEHMPADSPEIAFVSETKAEARWGLGDFQTSSELFSSLIPRFTRLYGGEDPHTVRTLSNCAYLRQLEGDWLGAEVLYREALARVRQLPPSLAELQLRIENNLAKLLEQQGDLASAEPLLRSGVNSCAGLFGDDSPIYAIVAGNLGDVLVRRGRPEEAEPLLRTALDIYRDFRGARHPDVAADYEDLASCLAAIGKLTEAESLAREALSIRQEALGAGHPELAESLDLVGRLLQQAGDFDAARALHRDALRIDEALYGASHPRLAETLALLARCAVALGEDQDARALLERAALAYESTRNRAGTGLARATLELDPPYATLAATQLALDETALAWDAAERAQGRVLADLLVAAGRRALDDSEREQEDALRENLDALEARLEALQLDTESGDARESAALRQDLLESEARWASFQEHIVARYPVTEGGSFALDRVQKQLDPSAALVGWLVAPARAGEEQCWAYVLRSQGAVRWVRLDDEEHDTRAITENSASLREAFRAGSDALMGVRLNDELSAQCASVGEMLIAPVLSRLEGVDALVIIPSGPALGTPIEALVDAEGHTLADRFAVSYAPSATVYSWLRESAPRHDRRRALLLGDPPFREEHRAAATTRSETTRSGTARSGEARAREARWSRESLAELPRLRWAGLELREVATAFDDPMTLAGRDASEPRLDALARDGELGSFGVIHLATHALVDDQRPERSALVLSQLDLPDPVAAALAGDRVYDGVLTAREIVQRWKLDADLVTLSACETGLGREVRGEGYIGLAHAFFQAGANSLLVSLWKVDDEATSRLMRRFYERRAAGDSKTRALQDAKQWLRERRDENGRRSFAHPYYWAAFILLGDDR